VAALIPYRYAHGMETKQITVRVPEELVNWVDAEVVAGRARSRAAVVSKALRREARLQAYERDAQILAECGGQPYPDLAGLDAYFSQLPVPPE
jgi:Arc/MetJ-type ribon-helix-helix transcriptional regulator